MIPEAGAAWRCIWIVTGTAQHLRRQRRNRRRHRRAEEERLTTDGQVRQDLANLGEKAHVEHAVRLVEDEVLELIHPRVARSHVIQQPAGRRDDDVDAAPERVLLRSHPDAAEDRGAGDRRVDRERGEIFEDLRRKLPRRRQHERARRAPRLVDQTVENREQKRRRLAAAGLRGGNDVLAEHRRRDRFGLNRRGPDEAELFDALEERRMKPEMIEWHGALWH